MMRRLIDAALVLLGEEAPAARAERRAIVEWLARQHGDPHAWDLGDAIQRGEHHKQTQEEQR